MPCSHRGQTVANPQYKGVGARIFGEVKDHPLSQTWKADRDVTETRPMDAEM